MKKDALKALGLTHQEPPSVVVRTVPPAGKYRKHEYTPCPWCGKTMYECNGTTRQAVICLSTRGSIAYMRARCCPTKGEARNGNFKLPIA